MTLEAYLRPTPPSGGPLPATTNELLDDIQTGQRMKLAGYEDLPKTARGLVAELNQLLVAGRVERRGYVWHWKPEGVKAEPQERRLFS